MPLAQLAQDLGFEGAVAVPVNGGVFEKIPRLDAFEERRGVQEMNREVNTIGSKANDSLISREVVTLKAELEKFREQAQNVE